MVRKVKVNKLESKIIGTRYVAWLDAPDQVHGAPSGKTPREALDNLAKSGGVYPQNRAFVAQVAAKGKGMEER